MLVSGIFTLFVFQKRLSRPMLFDDVKLLSNTQTNNYTPVAQRKSAVKRRPHPFVSLLERPIRG